MGVLSCAKMFFYLSFIGFLGIFRVEGVHVKNLECIAIMEGLRECMANASDTYDVESEIKDDREDFAERKNCNYVTAVYDNCTYALRDCFPQEEINFWIDSDLSVYHKQKPEFYENWDSEKCPPFRKMLERNASDQSTSYACRSAMESYHNCRLKADNEWEESEDFDDGRPDYSERKICNFKTSWLADCPSKLLDVCKTKDEIERMQFWELFSEDVYDGNWDMDKCPAVKEVSTRWNDLKEILENSAKDESDEGLFSCEELKGTARTEGCLHFDCSTGSMKVEMLEKCKELINAQVQNIVKRRLEDCKG